LFKGNQLPTQKPIAMPDSEIGRGSGQLILARPFKAGKNDRPSVRVTAVTLDFTRR